LRGTWSMIFETAASFKDLAPMRFPHRVTSAGRANNHERVHTSTLDNYANASGQFYDLSVIIDGPVASAEIV
jgi:hypothetical protein